MKYYIDKSGKLYEKSGIDYLIENELDIPDELNIDELVEATAEQVDEALNPKPTIEQLKEQAKFTRDNAISNYKGVVEFDGAEFDSSESALDSVLRAIRISENSDEKIVHNWRLADNTFKELSLNDLIEVKKIIENDVDCHFKMVWDMFSKWSSSKTHEEFVIENKV